MREQFTAPARLLGIGAATTILVTAAAYGVTLAFGFLSLTSPDEPIDDPHLAIMESLILILAPAMVALMAAVHAWAPRQFRALSFTAVCLMVMLATVTCSLHFVILTVGREPGVMQQAGMNLLLGFRWPSIAYSLDILAWDGFFAISMLVAAPVFRGTGLCLAIRTAMVVSGVLALAGFGGAFSGIMRLRDIGIAGYLGGFLVVDALLLALFLGPTARGEPR